MLNMGILDAFFGGKKTGVYKTAEWHADNRRNKLEATPQILGVLKEQGVTEESSLHLEFFFYTNSSEKASRLSKELSDLGYSSGFGPSAYNATEFLVTGWSIPVKMDEQSVLDWTVSMCDLAAGYDCEFDGWGTNPDQT